MRTIIFYAAIIFSCTPPDDGSNCIDTNCSDYSSQAAAQLDFESDPECRNDLDADHDGIACESFFNNQDPNNSGGDCPATSNCGCSNKKKSECASKCCQWIVGDGCKCK